MSEEKYCELCVCDGCEELTEEEKAKLFPEGCEHQAKLLDDHARGQHPSCFMKSKKDGTR